MTAQPNVVFKVVKSNPTDADVAAIGEALRTLAFAASTDTMPESSSALDNWGSVKRQFTPIVAYSPTAYSNNS